MEGPQSPSFIYEFRAHFHFKREVFALRVGDAKKCVVVSIDFRVSTSLCGDAVSSRYLTDFFAISSNKRWGAYFCIFVKRITLHYNINSAITQTFESGLAVTLQLLNAKNIQRFDLL